MRTGGGLEGGISWGGLSLITLIPQPGHRTHARRPFLAEVRCFLLLLLTESSGFVVSTLASLEPPENRALQPPCITCSLVTTCVTGSVLADLINVNTVAPVAQGQREHRKSSQARTCLTLPFLSPLTNQTWESLVTSRLSL
jgi:hypothetical protein